MKIKISIVIPVYNDNEYLSLFFERVPTMTSEAEVIVVEGSHSTRSHEIAEQYHARWLTAPRGRATQMNAGARVARGEVLWFVHADNRIDLSMCETIQLMMKNPNMAGGAMSFALEEKEWYAPWLNSMVNLRSRWLRLPYGDQGIFIRSSVFHSIDGYEEIPFLEDVSLMRRIQGGGEFVILPHRIGVSPRRWQKHGFLKTSMKNIIAVLAYKGGVSVKRIHRWYHGEQEPEPQQKEVSV